MLEINVTQLKEPKDNVLGLASFKFNDQFYVQNIRIMKSQNDEIFVSMPSYKKGKTDQDGKTQYQQYVNPVTREFREKLYSAILEQYEKGGGSMAVETGEPKIAFDGYFNPYTKEESKIRGLVNVVIDGMFAVNGVGVYQGRGKKNFVISMPSYKTSNVDENGNPIYKQIYFPVSRDFAKSLYKTISEMAMTEERAHFNEQGKILEENKQREQNKAAQPSEAEDGFMNIPEDVAEMLPFMEDEQPMMLEDDVPAATGEATDKAAETEGKNNPDSLKQNRPQNGRNKKQTCMF